MTTNTTTAISSHFQRALNFHKLGKLQLAVEAYSRSIKQEPSHLGSYINLGSALRSLGKFDSARLCYQRAIILSENDASVLSNYGNLLCDMGLYIEAEAIHKKVLELDGKSQGYLYNAAIVPFSNNKPKEAIQHFNDIIKHEPEHINANWNRGLSFLQLGQFENGFKGYEWRLKLVNVPERVFDKPRWKKESLKGKTILLTAEQGFGDMLQFARFIPLIADKAKNVIVECRPELMLIMKSVKGVSEVVRIDDSLPEYDFYLPLLSVPNQLKISLNNVPADAPYFSVEPMAKKYLPVSQHKRLRIGLIWAGKLTPKDRSCDLENFLPLMQNSNVTFYSFQLGPRRDDISTLGADAFIYDMSGSIKDFSDTAGFMQHMDLIITIDSAAAHLAGALGLPTWLLLLHSSDWRWMLDTNQSPWYPSMQLFRQTKYNDWSECVTQVHTAFNKWMKSNIEKLN